MSKLSIIVPVCSTDKNVENCIKSIISQSYADLEIVLCDYSPAGTQNDVCNTFAAEDSHIKVLRCENGSRLSAYNHALDSVTGDYIIFAAANSIFETDVLKKCMDEISVHSPDLLACAVKAPEGEKRDKIFMDCNMYTRFEYTENIAAYIRTGIGFDYIDNKVFSAHIINSRNLRFDETMPMVALQLFNCRYFTIAGHIRCSLNLICRSGKKVQESTLDYLPQGKAYSQKLIDAVQSKGLYNTASAAITEKYQKILYRHMQLVALPNNNITDYQRLQAMEALSKSADNVPLTVYLSTVQGIKNKTVYQLYKLRQWKLLLSLLKG